MIGHTPGPWVAENGTQNGGRGWGCWDVFAADKAGTYVAGINRENDCEEANARLIAAAPELLSSLQFAVKLLTGLPHVGGTAQIDHMRAVIAKATGAAE